MRNKLLIVILTMIAAKNFAFAQVDANNADQAALDGIKGLGPTSSRAIIAERSRGGEFKDWTDFENRVKGVGEKKSVHLSQAGLLVNGKSKPGAPATPPRAASKPAMFPASSHSSATMKSSNN